MKKKIEDPARPAGYYLGYDSARDCLADYESEVGKHRTSEMEAIAGYTCLWVCLVVIVALSVLAGLFHW